MITKTYLGAYIKIHVGTTEDIEVNVDCPNGHKLNQHISVGQNRFCHVCGSELRKNTKVMTRPMFFSDVLKLLKKTNRDLFNRYDESTFHDLKKFVTDSHLILLPIYIREPIVTYGQVIGDSGEIALPDEDMIREGIQDCSAKNADLIGWFLANDFCPIVKYGIVQFKVEGD